MSIEADPDAQTVPGVLVLRIDMSLYFATSEAPEDRIRGIAVATGSDLAVVVLDLEGVNFVDSQRADAIAKIIDAANLHAIDVRLARVKATVLEVLDRAGVVALLGDDGGFPEVYSAVKGEKPTDTTGRH